LLLACLGAGLAQADEAIRGELALKIVSNGSTQIVTKTQLARQLSPAEITVYSPVYDRPMTYQGSGWMIF